MDTFRQIRSCNHLCLNANKMNGAAEYCLSISDWMLPMLVIFHMNNSEAIYLNYKCDTGKRANLGF